MSRAAPSAVPARAPGEAPPGGPRRPRSSLRAAFDQGGRVLRDLVFAVAHELAQLLELPLGRVRLALGATAAELLAGALDLLRHLAQIDVRARLACAPSRRRARGRSASWSSTALTSPAHRFEASSAAAASSSSTRFSSASTAARASRGAICSRMLTGSTLLLNIEAGRYAPRGPPAVVGSDAQSRAPPATQKGGLGGPTWVRTRNDPVMSRGL
jgi:hypothetical protein